MAFEVLLGEDIIVIASPKVQTVHGTRLTDSDIEAGKRVRLNTATLGDLSIARTPGTPRAGSRTEFPVADNEKVTGHDSALTFAMDCESFMLGYGLSHIFQDVDSVQEGATTHYTHTMAASDPLAVSGTRASFITSVYLDSGGPDAGRLVRVLPDLAISGVSLSGRGKDIVSLAVEHVGSGLEVSNPAIDPMPALPTQVLFANDGVKLEYGDRGGSLTDISERLSEWSLRFNKVLALDSRYYPGSGLYGKRLWFLRRTFSIDLALFVSRANRDLVDDMLNRTRKEIKVTIDSGVLAGTSTGTNHKLVARYPDVRIGESPIQFNADGAVYGVRVAEDQIYKDSTIAASPCTVTLDNDTTAYLVPMA